MNAATQRKAALLKRIYDEQTVRPRDGESQQSYFKRLQEKAMDIERKERARKRKAARAARKRNR